MISRDLMDSRRRLEGTLSRALLCAIPFLLFLAGTAARSQPQRLTISHVTQVEDAVPALRMYLDIENEDGTFVGAIAAGALSGTLGQGALQVGLSRAFTEGDEGVAYIFLIDVSASLSATQFNDIREAIDAWLSNLGPRDRAALISFGETSEVKVDLTGDTTALRAGLLELGPTDRLTLLHQALADALTMSQRRDADLPSRRVIVLLSDGRDEGSGLALDDVLQRLRDQPMPIYAIGHSQFGEPQRSRDLNVLRRLASNSGGAFFEADRTEFAQSYAWIGRAIDRVVVVDAKCPTCSADGRAYRLQLRLEQEGRVLSEGAEVRLLPMSGGTGSDQESASPAGSDPTEASRVLDEAPVEDEASGLSWLLWPLGLGFLVVAALGALALSKRKGSMEREVDLTAGLPGPESQATTEPVPAPASRTVPGADFAEEPPDGNPSASAGMKLRGSPLPAGGLAPTPQSLPQIKLRERSDIESDDDLTLDPERPTRRRVVRFVVVRGGTKGREYRTVLRARAVVGSRSTCDCVLTGEENISAEQFELVQRNDTVYLQNLDDLKPTLLNGLAIREREQVKSGDLIGTQDTILRLMLD